MAMLAKRRAVDFSTREMVLLSKCSNDRTFTNRLEKICERYGIDRNLFRMGGNANERSEAFYPAECAELVALLIRCEKKNPASRGNATKENATATCIRDYYQMLLDETEMLPAPFRKLVYSLPCHLVAEKIVLWSDMLVEKLSVFSDLYMKEGSEDIGALLKYLSIKMDESTYIMFSSKRYIDAIAGQYPCTEQEDEFLKVIEWFNIGAKETTVGNPFDLHTSSNIGLDVGIAKIIQLIMEDISSLRDDLQYEKPESVEDVEVHRRKFYDEKIEVLVQHIGNYKNYEFSIHAAQKGAENYRPYDVRIKEGELSSKDALIQYYQKEILERENDIRGLQSRIMLLESMEEPDFFSRKIHDDYVEKCRNLQGSETKKSAEKFIGELLWNFLYEGK